MKPNLLKPEVLVAGVGNILLGDEGVGVHAVRELLRQGRNEGADVIDAGTALDEIIGRFAAYSKVVLVDAFDSGGPAGQLYRLEIHSDCDLRFADLPLSVHEYGVAEALQQARRAGILPPEVVLLGAQPARIEPGMILSPEIARVLPALLNLIRAEIDLRFAAG